MRLVYHVLSGEKAKVFKEILLGWSKKNLRDFPWRREKEPYKIVVTEKLLQQTDFGHVRKVYDIFFRKFPTVFDLARTPEEEIERVLKPLGLWRQRAKQLKQFAEVVVTKHAGEIPDTYNGLKNLPGIGDYAARATLCFAFEKPTYLLDVNTRKVVTRFFFHPVKVKDAPIINALERVTPRDFRKCKLFNWGLIDFSAIICSRKPKCKKCPIKKYCSLGQHDCFKEPLDFGRKNYKKREAR